MEDAADIEDFPSTAVAAAHAVRRASGALAAASLERAVTRRGSGDLLVMRCIDFVWRFYLARQEDRVVFFFIRTTSDLEVVLDAEVTFRFTPLAPPFPPLVSDAASYRWVLPPFVVQQPSPTDLARWAPPGALPRETLILCIGPYGDHVLAVHFADDQGPDRLAYTTADGTTLIAASDDHWPVAAITDLLDTLRTWTTSDPEAGPHVPLVATTENDVVRIVVALTRGWIAACAQARPTEDDMLEALAWLISAYDLDDLHARVLLRLAPNGDFATAQADDPLQLALHVHVMSRESLTCTTAAIAAPDFLATGPLASAFVELARSEDVVQALHAALGLSDAALRDLLDQPTAKWTIFRIARRPTSDTDVFVWEGDNGGQSDVLAFRADVVVDATTEPPEVGLGAPPNVGRLLFDRADGAAANDFAGVRAYVLRLLTEIHRWVALAM